MGRHVIVTEENGQRVRLRGVLSDAVFFGLPIVKEWGCLPSGYHAGHFGDGDDELTRAYLSLPESERDAVQVLRETYHKATDTRYLLRQGDTVLGYFRSKGEARKALYDAARSWRDGYDFLTGRSVEPSGGWYRGLFTAVKLERRYGDETGALDVAYYLKSRRGYHAMLCVIERDIRRPLQEVA